MNVDPLDSFIAEADWGTTGLVGTLGVTVLTFAGAEYRPRQTSGITEVATLGYYQAQLPGLVAGDYVLDWDDGVDHAYETLYVGRSGQADRWLARRGLDVD